MTERTRASIIIPNFNGKRHLERLLPSIANQTSHNYEVIVLDDCSSDRSAVEYTRTFIRSYPNMALVENEQNMGFVKTCNKGFGLANAEYVCILTNDTIVADNFVERNVRILDEDPSIAVLSCIIVDQDGNNWFSGGDFRAGVRRNLKDDFQGIRPVDWVAGTACFYKKELFDKIGRLDERFVMYHEDLEFCLRVKRNTEYRLCMFSDKLVTHCLGGGGRRGLDTAKVLRLRYYGHRNYILLLKMYYPNGIKKALLSDFLDMIRDIAVLTPIGILACVRTRHPRYLIIAIQAAIHTARGTLEGLRMKQIG